MWGVCQNTARDIVYGGFQYQGVGLYNIHASMGIEYVTAIVEHMWMCTTTSNLLLTSMEQLQLKLGGLGSIFSMSYDTYGRLAIE